MLLGGFQAGVVYFPYHGHVVVQASQSVVVKGSNQGGLGIFLNYRSVHYTLLKLTSKLPGRGFILLHAVQTNLQIKEGKLELFPEHIKEYWPADITLGTVGSLHAKCSG